MHHKRRRPKNRRAGCKLCKPWKTNGWRTESREGEKTSDHIRRKAADEAIHLLSAAENALGFANSE